MEARRDQHKDEERRGPLRVAVVGHCASGKTTLVGALRRAGYDAYAVAQEHSAITWLWKHADPSVLIYIDVPLATVRARRGQEWPKAVYDAQEERLTEARAHADLILNSSAEDVSAMTAHALDALSRLQAPRGEATEVATNPS
jgi:hypothetical protein